MKWKPKMTLAAFLEKLGKMRMMTLAAFLEKLGKMTRTKKAKDELANKQEIQRAPVFLDL